MGRGQAPLPPGDGVVLPSGPWAAARALLKLIPHPVNKAVRTELWRPVLLWTPVGLGRDLMGAAES